MDWGIVASALVAMALFTVAAGILVFTMIGLFVWLLKKRAGKGGQGFKFQGCPLTKAAQDTQ